MLLMSVAALKILVDKVGALFKLACLPCQPACLDKLECLPLPP